MWFFCCLSYQLLQIYINFVNSQTFEYTIWGDKWRNSIFFLLIFWNFIPLFWETCWRCFVGRPSKQFLEISVVLLLFLSNQGNNWAKPQSSQGISLRPGKLFSECICCVKAQARILHADKKLHWKQYKIIFCHSIYPQGISTRFIKI